MEIKARCYNGNYLYLSMYIDNFHCNGGRCLRMFKLCKLVIIGVFFFFSRSPRSSGRAMCRVTRNSQTQCA